MKNKEPIKAPIKLTLIFLLCFCLALSGAFLYYSDSDDASNHSGDFRFLKESPQPELLIINLPKGTQGEGIWFGGIN